MYHLFDVDLDNLPDMPCMTVSNSGVKAIERDSVSGHTIEIDGNNIHWGSIILPYKDWRWQYPHHDTTPVIPPNQNPVWQGHYPWPKVEVERKAWVCPRCDVVNAPHIDQCDCEWQSVL